MFLNSTNGLSIIHNGKTILINSSGIFDSLSTNDNDLIIASKLLFNFNQSIERISADKLIQSDLKIEESKYLNEINNPTPLFKYISKADYENFISKGYFQLGSSQYYREIEKEESRDKLEGFSISILNVNNYKIPITLFRCNNYLIFCGTTTRSNDYMNKKFGEVEIKISDSFSFASKIAKSIGAKGFTIGKVEYSNSKIYKSNHLITQPFEPQDFIHNQDVLDLLLSVSLYPSLFVKPKMFENEKETRIIFEMNNDYPTCHRFLDKSLLSEIQII